MGHTNRQLLQIVQSHHHPINTLNREVDGSAQAIAGTMSRSEIDKKTAGKKERMRGLTVSAQTSHCFDAARVRKSYQSSVDAKIAKPCAPKQLHNQQNRRS